MHGAVKVIDDNETAPIDVLPKIDDFLLGQFHLSRFGNIGDGVVKNLRTAQLDKLVRDWFHIDERRLGYQLIEVHLRGRIVVRPACMPDEPVRTKLPPSHDEFGRRWIVIRNKKSPETLSVRHR